MKNKTFTLDYGSGGKISNAFVSEVIKPFFSNVYLDALGDGAVLDINAERLAFSTDSYVVDPIFFPGGNIGDLAVNGTVNDLSMCGARPLFLSVGLIIEEGFSMDEMKIILNSMKEAALKADVKIVTGDTKVVSKGAADKIFINTSGIGKIYKNTMISGAGAKPGDKVILSGSMADHGAAILINREGLMFDSKVKSDSAPLNHMVGKMIESGSEIHVLRDPTRGGVGTTLNEIAEQSGVKIVLNEEKIPVKPEVNGICELLGLDPLYIANEGKLLAFVEPSDVERVLEIMNNDEFGKDACVIGEVAEEKTPGVYLKTAIGGERIVSMLTGEQLPRIC